jgi:transcriptional regulator
MASDSEVLASIDRKLSILIGLQAYLLVRQMSITEGAPILRRLGMKPSEIADVFETTAATVSVGLSKARKKRSK